MSSNDAPAPRGRGRIWIFLTVAAGVVGLLLVWDSTRSISATYDEVTYLEVGARWWREGDAVGITRMGSPLLFWKIQQAPVYWILDRTGRGNLIDEPIARQAELLPIVRAGASWIWLLGLVLTAWWARLLNGPRAMAAAAWIYALSPNLLAHGTLITMETPLTVAATAMLLAFWAYLRDRRRRWFWASAILGGLAFSCKYTVILLPPILAVVWWLDGLRWGMPRAEAFRHARRVALGMAAYVAVLLLGNFALTGFAMLPLSPTKGAHPSVDGRFGPLGPLAARLYETPIPQDWVGLANQFRHQASGGPSYLMGERRMTGWWYYYFVAMAVKVPLAFWLLVVGRLIVGARGEGLGRSSDRMLIQVITLFLIVTALGSSRNYGLRYLLPLAPLAIVWASRVARVEDGETLHRARAMNDRMAQREGEAPAEPALCVGLGGSLALPNPTLRGRLNAIVRRPRWGRRGGLVTIAILGQAVAVASVHPNELTYFNVVAGGPSGGRWILSDSNFDWGQGLKALARLQRENPAYRDITLYYFGDTEPRYYGVEGVAHVINAVDDHPELPPIETATTPYIAVSTSLQFGPWGPEGFFRKLDGLKPVAMSEDATIAVYRAADLGP